MSEIEILFEGLPWCLAIGAGIQAWWNAERLCKIEDYIKEQKQKQEELEELFGKADHD